MAARGYAKLDLRWSDKARLAMPCHVRGCQGAEAVTARVTER